MILLHDLAQLTPMWLLAAAAGLILLLVVAPGYKRAQLTGAGHLTFVALAALAFSSWLLWGYDSSAQLLGGALVYDGLAATFGGVAVLAGFITVLMSTAYLQEHKLAQGEFYALVLLSCVGMLMVTMAADLLVLFIGIEMMSLAAYVLAGFRRGLRRPQEAALKYFVYGAFASAVIVFGIAQVFGEMGRLTGVPRLDFTSIGVAFAAHSISAMGCVGVAFILAGLLFKVAAVPFHMWAPDVYEGAPTPAAAFLATGIKAAGFAGLCRFCMATLAYGLHGARGAETAVQLIEIVAVASMILGNVLAIRQTQIKRMLAYSSIAHAGYVLVGLCALLSSPDTLAASAMAYYLFGYTAMTMGAMAVAMAFERQDDQRVDLTTERLAGAGHRYPALGLAMAVFMFGLAGIPPTTGFFGKLSLFSAAIACGRGELAVVGVLASAAGAYYYLRVLAVMYMGANAVAERRVHSFWLGAALWVCAGITLGVGILPEAYMGFARHALAGWKG